jgi:hypothetical protein
VPAGWLRGRKTIKDPRNRSRQSAYKGKLLIRLRRFSDSGITGYLVMNPEPAEGEPKYLLPDGHAERPVAERSGMRRGSNAPERI